MDKLYSRAIRLSRRYCELLDLPESIQRQVEEIYYEVQDKPDLKGKRLEVVIAATVYLACKRNMVNVHPAALEPLADVNQLKILKLTKILLRHIPMVSVHSSEYVQLFCSKLQIPVEHIQIMTKLCKDIDGYDFFDSQLPKPRTIAAAVIYFYLSKQEPSLRKSIQEIKEVAGILTDNTIKKYCSIMQEKQSFLLKDNLKEKESLPK